jgi:glycerol kinase
MADLASQVLAAIKTSLGGASAAQIPTLTTVATDLATGLATIASERVQNQISDDDAKTLMDGVVNGAEAALEGQLAMEEGDVKTALTAGLNVLITVGATAVGAPWAAPIIQAVVDAL